jgi:hypothetical protein
LIHIDIYEKITFNYREHISKLLNFPFLPVHRLSFILDIPSIHRNIKTCLDKQCINGKCRSYFNKQINETFCQCKKGSTGKFCTIKHDCNCSSDSICIGKLANDRSLCVCPLNKMGPRCFIDNTAWQSNENEICLNVGQCIPLDEYGTSNNKFICICRRDFSGDKCEIVGTTLIMSFDKDPVLFSSIRIHLIQAQQNDFPVRTTTVKPIPAG